jgi:outer membrane receptor protein involved in Fe transport
MKKIKVSVLTAKAFQKSLKTPTNQNAAEASKSGTNSKHTRTTSILLTISMFLIMFPVIVSAQAVSGVTGIVSDPAGAVIPGVQVILVDTKTSREFTATTNEQGVYIFNNVQPGAGYRLTFTGQGFQTLVLNDVQLGIGRTETQNIELTTGQVTETVEVVSTTGDATLNTTDASIGNIIGQRQLRELPIQIRSSPAALIGLQPGAIGANVGTGASGNNRTGSVTGARADQGNITVDGIDANDQSTGQAFATVANAPIDSIQEFRAITANPGASEGRSSGGQIQLTTNSGTNEFHGNLREYYRGERFAANTFFNNRAGVPRPALQRHQFGGSLGGPLPMFNFGEGGPLFNSGKDKLFFFFDYEGRRDESESTNVRIVPLQSFREGRIGYINNSNGNTCPTNSRANVNPGCISYLTPEQVRALDPQGIGVNQAFLNYLNNRYPLPNDLTGGNGINTGAFRFNSPVSRRDHTYTTRIDSNLTSKQKLFGRFTIARRNQTDTLNSVAQQFPDDVGGPLIVDRSNAWVVGHSWIISPAFFNQATVGVTTAVLDFPNTNAPAFPSEFTFGMGLSAPYAGIDQQFRTVKTPTIRDDMTWTKGSHTFQFGGQFKPIRSNSRNVNDLNFVTISGAALDASLRPANLRTGSAAVNTAVNNAFDAAFGFALGRYSSITTNYVYDSNGNPQAPGTGKIVNWAYDEYELYAQDNWKARSDLTLNFGLRWHYYNPPYETNGIQSASNVDYRELLDIRIANAAAGIGGAAAEPITRYDLVGKANDREPIYEGDKNNFAPRVGFAYNPSFKGGLMGAIFGDRKTVLRGGASMVYDRVGGGITFLLDQVSYIFDNSAAVNFTGANARERLLNNPRFQSINSLPVQPAAPPITRPFTPFVVGGEPVGLAQGQSNFQTDRNFQIPYSYTYSVGFQRELPGNFLLDVSYVGRKGRKLFAQADAAQVLDFKDPASGQFMLAAFNAVQTQLEAGTPAAGITPQPWIENQINLAVPGFCANDCTQLLADVYEDLFLTGGSADIVGGLFTEGLLRPNVGISAQFGGNFYYTNLGHSNYDGLLVSLQKRFSKGFEFDINYTFSTSKDNNSSVVNTVAGGVICDVTNVDSCYGPSDFDVRHLFNANGIWELPLGRGRAIGGDMPKWLDAIVGGWTISGVFGARSGFPISIGSESYTRTYFISTPAVFIGDRSALKVKISEDAGGIKLFENPQAVIDAFRFPRHGETGTRNSVRSPGFWNLDAAVSKRIKMPWSENHRLTLRAEAYNLTNSVSFNVPSTANLSIRSTSFGLISGALSAARELQFAVRYDF